MLPSEQSMRCMSCSLLISSEKKATLPPCRPTYEAMLSVKAVLPIDGRAATRMRSDACRPLVRRSRSLKPVGRPVMPPFDS